MYRYVPTMVPFGHNLLLKFVRRSTNKPRSFIRTQPQQRQQLHQQVQQVQQLPKKKKKKKKKMMMIMTMPALLLGIRWAT